MTEIIDGSIYRPYFTELSELKGKGELYQFSEVTREQLKTLWFDEVLTDAKISNLFDVQRNTVKIKRRELRINLRICINEKAYAGVNEKRKSDGLL